MKVKIVSDSTADIPEHLAKELGITIIPLDVIFPEDEVYEDRVTLMPTEFYEKVAEYQVIPTTSQPTPFAFEEIYRSILDEETAIISIHLSAKLSGTFQSASIAKQALDNPEHLHVIDSKRASYAFGMIAVELARMAQEGKSLEECLARLDELLSNTNIYFMVDTLDYLQKNGRIGKASALVGSLLKLKPILSLSQEGEVFALEKVRGQKKALNRLVAILLEQYGSTPIHLGISHAVNEQLAEELRVRLMEEFTVESDVITEIGAVIGAHVGPGAISITMTQTK